MIQGKSYQADGDKASLITAIITDIFIQILSDIVWVKGITFTVQLYWPSIYVFSCRTVVTVVLPAVVPLFCPVQSPHFSMTGHSLSPFQFLCSVFHSNSSWPAPLQPLSHLQLLHRNQPQYINQPHTLSGRLLKHVWLSSLYPELVFKFLLVTGLISLLISHLICHICWCLSSVWISGSVFIKHLRISPKNHTES